MNRSIALGIGIVAALAGVGLLSKPRRERIGSLVSSRMQHRMEHMMDKLPENAPPKLVMTVLPRLREQNEQILALLREQNALLRERLHEPT